MSNWFLWRIDHLLEDHSLKSSAFRIVGVRALASSGSVDENKYSYGKECCRVHKVFPGSPVAVKYSSSITRPQ